MTTRTLLGVALAALAVGAVAGFVVAKHTTSPPPAQSVSVTDAPAPRQPKPRLLAGQTPGPASAALEPADFETRLRQLASGPSRKRWERLRDLASSVAPEDARQALTLAEKILPRQEWGNFRYNLLQKWAEADPQAVLNYGLGLKSRNDRQNALSLVS